MASFTAAQRAKAVALRELGLSIAAIAEQTGMAPRTLSRLFSETSTAKGRALIDEVKNELTKQILSDDSIRHRMAGLILDDCLLAQRVRDKLNSTLDKIEAEDLGSAVLSARALAALSTALKTSSDTLRQHFNKFDIEPQPDLPQLQLLKMSDEEIQAMRELQRTESSTFDVVDDGEGEPPGFGGGH